MKAILFFILKTLCLLILPFIALIRGAVYFHSEYNYHPQMAILGGGLVTLVLLIIYFSWFYGRLTGKLGSKESFKFRIFLAAALVIGYCAHGLFFFNNKNLKKLILSKENLKRFSLLK